MRRTELEVLDLTTTGPVMQTAGSFGTGAFLTVDQATDERIECEWLRGPGTGRGWIDLGNRGPTDGDDIYLSFRWRMTYTYVHTNGIGNPGLWLSDSIPTDQNTHGDMDNAIGVSWVCDSDHSPHTRYVKLRSRVDDVEYNGDTLAFSEDVTYTMEIWVKDDTVYLSHDGSTLSESLPAGAFDDVTLRYLAFPVNRGSASYDNSSQHLDGWMDEVEYARTGSFKSIAESRAAELGAVLHLPLDDFSTVGGAVATIGSDGTYSGGPTLQATGPSDYLPYGITTDGVDDYVTTPSLTLGNTQAQSWEWWSDGGAEHNTTTGGFLFFGTYTDPGGIGTGPRTGLLTNEVMTVYETSAADERTGWSGSVIADGWHHHVLTFDGTQGEWIWYLDGDDATNQGFSRIENLSGSRGFPTSTYYVSRSTGSYFAWDMAAFSVYDFELTPKQVYENYRLGLDLGVGTSFHPVGY